MTKRNNNYDFSAIKANILGFSGGLLLATNSVFKSDTVVVYKFTSKDIKTDSDLQYILFGRECSNNAIKIDKMACNTLATYYKAHLIDFVTTVEQVEKVATENNCNYGFALEIMLVNSGLYRKATNKQDRNGIDLIEIATNKLFQLKTSIFKPNSKGSAGTTNKSAHK